MASALGASKTVLYSGTELLEGLAMRRTDLFATDATGILRFSEGATALDVYCAQALSGESPVPLPPARDYSRRSGFARPPQ